MYSYIDREKEIEKIIDILRNKKYIRSIVLVGSLANEYCDEYSDIDLSVVVEDNKVEEVWRCFEKDIINNFDYFKYFKMKYNSDSLLYGIFLNNALEIDIGFNSYNMYANNRMKHISKVKVLYGNDLDDNANTLSIDETNIIELIEERISDMWYNFKNCVFALKRGREFRAINELDEIKNQIIEIYALDNNLTFKHYKDLDKLDNNIKLKIKDICIKKYDMEGLKDALIKSLYLFCEIIREKGYCLDADNYCKLFNELIEEVNL